MPHVRFERVTPDRADLLGTLAPDLFQGAINRARLDRFLAQPGSLLVVARDGELVVGQAKGAIHWHLEKPADVYLDEVVVAEGYRRRGIAQRLVTEISAWARERGCADAWLATDPANAAAHALYASFAESKPSVLYFWDL